MLNWLPALFILLMQGSSGPDLASPAGHDASSRIALSAAEISAKYGLTSSRSRHFNATEVAFLALILESATVNQQANGYEFAYGDSQELESYFEESTSKWLDAHASVERSRDGPAI